MRPPEKVDEEVRDAAVAGVLDLGDVLELIDNGFDHDSFSEYSLSTRGRRRFFMLRLSGVMSRTAKVSTSSLVKACER